jgi:hypothetical protein
MAKKDGKVKAEKKKNKNKSSFGSFDTDDFFNAALNVSMNKVVEGKETQEEPA